jgi:hypothetical protein
MKKIFSVILALILLLGLPIAALAQVPAPGGPFSSSFQVQNLDASAATMCTFTLYDAAGIDAFTSNQTSIQPGDSLYVYVPDLSLDDGMYSGVVMCDRKVAAVTNFSDDDSGASHSGVADPATTWFAPGIYDNFYNYYSNIVVQNATDTAVNVTVEIFAPGNATPVATQTANAVPAYSSASFQQEGLTQLNNNQFYSAKITGTGDVAVVVNIYGKGGADNQLYSYNAFQSGSTNAYAPIIMNNYYGYSTSLVIQNMGANPANVTVGYTNGSSDNYTIQPGAAQSIYTPSELPAGNTLYGATVTSTNGQPIVVLVNQSDANRRASSYIGFSNGGQEMRAPIVMKNYYTYETSITCQNVGGAPTTMTITYAGVTSTSISPSIPVGGTHLFYQGNDPVLSGVGANWISSASITASQNIVCVVNEDKTPAYRTTQGDFHYSYEAILP